MSDLEDRLRVVERVPVPDVWERAAARSHYVPSGGSLPDPSPRRHERLAAALVAAAVAIAAIAFVVRAFGGAEDRIAEPSPSPMTDLDRTSWVLTTIDGEAVVRGTEDSWFTLQFRDGTFAAGSVCGRIDGTYQIDKGSLRTQVRGVTDTFGACGSALSDGHSQIVARAFGAESEASVHGATLILDLGEHRLELVQDPCSVLAREQVNAAVGGGVESVTLVPPSGLKAPSFGPVCSYDVPSTPYSSVGVDVETSTLQQFESDAVADEANFMDISGVGERAYISGMNSIVIFDGDRTIEIGFQHGAGDAAVPVLEALGRAAVNVPASEDSPGSSLEGTAAPIRFVAAPGWATRLTPGGPSIAPEAWTTNATLYPDEQPGVTFPDGTLSQLPETGVLIVAFQAADDRESGKPNFPEADLPLLLPQHVQSSWEGFVPGRGRSTIEAGINGRAVEVWVFYGTPEPSEATRAEAASALARLVVAPAHGSPAADSPDTTAPTHSTDGDAIPPSCRDWLRAGLVVAGAPTGDDLHDWTVEDGEDPYLHLVPPNAQFEVSMFAEEPDLVNVEIDTIPVVGRAGDFTLHANRVMDVWQLIAESDDVWVTAHIDPPAFAPSDRPALDWLQRLADYVREHPAPPCDP